MDDGPLRVVLIALTIFSIWEIVLGIILVLKLIGRNPYFRMHTLLPEKLLSDDRIWHRTHRFLGWAMVAAGGFSLMCILFLSRVCVGMANDVRGPLCAAAVFIPFALAFALAHGYLRRL